MQQRLVDTALGILGLLFMIGMFTGAVVLLIPVVALATILYFAGGKHGKVGNKGH